MKAWFYVPYNSESLKGHDSKSKQGYHKIKEWTDRGAIGFFCFGSYCHHKKTYKLLQRKMEIKEKMIILNNLI